MHNISLATSKITDKVRENVDACLNENRIGQGRFNLEFEEKATEYFDVKHAISVSSGSMADVVALAAIKIKNPGKTEVIVPALTFIAHTNSVIINGLKPVFVDVGFDYQIDVEQVKKKINSKTLAIFPVHLLGKSCDIEEIVKIANKKNVAVIEDCCEAFGGKIGKKRFGTFGDFGTFSFFPSHTITTGEGGMIITNDDELAELARSLRNHGRRSEEILEKFHFDHIGFNAKMSNILAAIGVAMIDEADSVIEKRKQNVQYLNKLFSDIWYAESPHCYPMMAIERWERNKEIIHLEENGIESRKLFSCIPTQEKAYDFLEYEEGKFPIAEKIGNLGYFLPIHQDLTEEDLDYMISKV